MNLLSLSKGKSTKSWLLGLQVGIIVSPTDRVSSLHPTLNHRLTTGSCRRVQRGGRLTDSAVAWQSLEFYQYYRLVIHVRTRIMMGMIGRTSEASSRVRFTRLKLISKFLRSSHSEKFGKNSGTLSS